MSRAAPGPRCTNTLSPEADGISIDAPVRSRTAMRIADNVELSASMVSCLPSQATAGGWGGFSSTDDGGRMGGRATSSGVTGLTAEVVGVSFRSSCWPMCFALAPNPWPGAAKRPQRSIPVGICQGCETAAPRNRYQGFAPLQDPVPVPADPLRSSIASAHCSSWAKPSLFPRMNPLHREKISPESASIAVSHHRDCYYFKI